MKIVKLLGLLLIATTLLMIGTVLADSPVPQPKYLDVQGAKVVSEGAYFYFNLTNKATEKLQIRIAFNYYFTWLDYEEYFWLNIDESKTFHLIAPYINDSYKELLITIKYAKGGLATDKPIETVLFHIFVVNAKIVIPELIVGVRKHTELWEKYVELEKENTWLKEQLKESEHENANLKEQLSVWEQLDEMPVGNPLFYQFDLGAVIGIAMLSSLCTILICLCIHIAIKNQRVKPKEQEQ